MQANLVRVRALGRFAHQGRMVVTGEIVELTEDDASAMCSRAIALAERLPEDDAQAKRANTYRRRDMKAEE